MSRTRGHNCRRYAGEKEWHADNALRRDSRQARDPGEDVGTSAHTSMRGTAKALLSGGCPYPGGAEVEFAQSDVRQLGKLYCWGSACVQFIVRLRDGREVFVRADKQGKGDERFLRRLAKPIRGWAPGRGEGFRTVWGAEV